MEMTSTVEEKKQKSNKKTEMNISKQHEKSKL